MNYYSEKELAEFFCCKQKEIDLNTWDWSLDYTSQSFLGYKINLSLSADSYFASLHIQETTSSICSFLAKDIEGIVIEDKTLKIFRLNKNIPVIQIPSLKENFPPAVYVCLDDSVKTDKAITYDELSLVVFFSEEAIFDEKLKNFSYQQVFDKNVITKFCITPTENFVSIELSDQEHLIYRFEMKQVREIKVENNIIKIYRNNAERPDCYFSPSNKSTKIPYRLDFEQQN